MTREEAIKVLSSYDVNGVWADVDGKPYNAEEQAEAFDMAIEALRAEEHLVELEAKAVAIIKSERHGEWKEEHLVTTMGGTYTVYRCSNCQRTVQPTAFNYCPNCGAKMDKAVI